MEGLFGNWAFFSTHAQNQTSRHCAKKKLNKAGILSDLSIALSQKPLGATLVLGPATDTVMLGEASK